MNREVDEEQAPEDEEENLSAQRDVDEEQAPEDEEENRTAQRDVDEEQAPEDEEENLTTQRDVDEEQAPEDEEDEAGEQLSAQREVDGTAPDDEDERTQVSAKPASVATGRTTTARLANQVAAKPTLAARIRAIRGGGQPLHESSRTFFEARFGRRFSQVRVHADSSANHLARAIRAKAFTVGPDIVFDSSRYSPSTTSGRRLLAHELTHVLQQCGSRMHLVHPKLSTNQPFAKIENVGHDQSSDSSFGKPDRQVQNRSGQLLSREGDVLQVQKAPTVSAPGDKFEQEAEQVADQVLQMPEQEFSTCSSEQQNSHLANRKSAGGFLSQASGEAVSGRQSSAPLADAKTAASPTAPNWVSMLRARRGGGQPLPTSVRAFAEPRFGRNFSGVRVHDDLQANALARSISARAFTSGRDIFFSSGYYTPSTIAGKRLVAHELTHVVQQTARTSVGYGPLKAANTTESETIQRQYTPPSPQPPVPTVRPPKSMLRSIYWLLRLGTKPAWERDAYYYYNNNKQGKRAAEKRRKHLANIYGKAKIAVNKRGKLQIWYLKPAQVPPQANLDASIRKRTQLFNNWFKGYPGFTTLDPLWVRAMVSVETSPGTDARRYDPMQVANQGDPAFPALLGKRRHTALVMSPSLVSKLKKKTATPRKKGRWYYKWLTPLERMDTATSVEAGITWLVYKAAIFGYVAQVDQSAAPRSYRVKSRDRVGTLARKLGTTNQVLTAMNPGVFPRNVQLGRTVLQYRTAHRVIKITGWRTWEKAAELYNGGGDPKYLSKVKKAYALLKRGLSVP